jgi:hypothetical protein
MIISQTQNDVTVIGIPPIQLYDNSLIGRPRRGVKIDIDMLRLTYHRRRDRSARQKPFARIGKSHRGKP